MTEHVKIEIADGVMTLTLQRPEKKNALTGAMYDGLSDALKQAEAQRPRGLRKPGARRKFRRQSGSSLHRNHQQSRQATDRCRAGQCRGRRHDHGLHCDLVYLADNARLMTPFVNLALVPEAASSWLLPLRIGHARAYAMFALGEPMEASAALACGLANAVVPRDELRKRAHDAAIALTKRPAGSLAQTKKLMRDHQRIAAQIAQEGHLFKERLKTPEAREAFAAFAERRPPDFTKVV